MQQLIKILTLSLGTLIATTAMAAPEQYNHYSGYNQHYQNQNHWNQNNNSYQQQVNPSRHWRVGQYLPNGYNSSRYEVDHHQARKLPNTGRNQQWYKINGDYVLVNNKNNRIVRIIG